MCRCGKTEQERVNEAMASGPWPRCLGSDKHRMFSDPAVHSRNGICCDGLPERVLGRKVMAGTISEEPALEAAHALEP